MTLQWNAVPGRSYRVEYKTDLNDPAWTPLGPNLQAAGDTATLADPVGTNAQRLYRIVPLP